MLMNIINYTLYIYNLTNRYRAIFSLSIFIANKIKSHFTKSILRIKKFLKMNYEVHNVFELLLE